DNLSPVSSCTLGSEEFVTIVIKNYGTKPIDSPMVAYSVNGNEYIEQIEQIINSGEEITYTFTNLCDLSTVGDFTIKAYTIYDTDANPFNDTLTYIVKNYTPSNIPYYLNFEDAEENSQLLVQNDNEDPQTWEISSSSGMDNSDCIIYSYNPSEPANDWFFSKCLELTAGTPYLLNFYYKAESDESSEKLKVHLAQAPNVSAAFTDPIIDLDSITETSYTLASAPFNVSDDGIYYIGFNVYSDANKWNLYIDNISVTVAGSINEKNINSGISVYPNPANNNINIEIQKFLPKQNNVLSIYDVHGQLIFSRAIQQAQTKIDISNFATGVYIIKLYNKNGVEVKRFVKE
ncbi:MAG: T9SS type A sorting domain-containing protein, partial [Bacteroidetes bacterium]|nr:T9SS type A sorting domain-containing protein [Bacteroidota bacterium]